MFHEPTTGPDCPDTVSGLITGVADFAQTATDAELTALGSVLRALRAARGDS